MFGTSGSSDGVLVLGYLLASAGMMLVPIGIFAFGEEIGWSGLIFEPLPGTRSALTPYIAGEGAVAIFLATSVLAWYFWHSSQVRGARKSTQTPVVPLATTRG